MDSIHKTVEEVINSMNNKIIKGNANQLVGSDEEIEKVMDSEFSDDSIDPQFEYDLIINENNTTFDHILDDIDVNDKINEEVNTTDVKDNEESIEDNGIEINKTDEQIGGQSMPSIANTSDQLVVNCVISDADNDCMTEKNVKKSSKTKKFSSFKTPLKSAKKSSEEEKTKTEKTSKTEKSSESENKTSETEGKSSKSKKKSSKNVNKSSDEEKSSMNEKSSESNNKTSETESKSSKSKKKSSKSEKSSKTGNKSSHKSEKRVKTEKGDKSVAETSGEKRDKKRKSVSRRSSSDGKSYKSKHKYCLNEGFLSQLFGQSGEQSATEPSELESMYSKQCKEWFKRETRPKSTEQIK